MRIFVVGCPKWTILSLLKPYSEKDCVPRCLKKGLKTIFGGSIVAMSDP